MKTTIPRKMDNVEILPLGELDDPQQVIAHVANRISKWPISKVIVIGQDEEDGDLYVASSNMLKSEGNWLLDLAKQYILKSEDV